MMGQAIDWEMLASHGTAPMVGCSMLGVGYEDAFDRLLKTYVDGRFARGLSSEKLVVGPFGSGKTHFLRQMMELAAAKDVVVSEVRLNKDLDFTKRLLFYREVAAEVAAPGQSERGIAGLLRAMRAKVCGAAPDEIKDVLFEAWISGLGAQDFRLDAFKRVAMAGLTALRTQDEPTFSAAARWLSGDVNDPVLAKALMESRVGTDQQSLFAGRMLLSLFQLVRHAGFLGTVLAVDEAEQGFSVDKKRRDRILSMLKSDVDSISALNGGSALVLYALTPEIREAMDTFPALHQRFADPGGVGFFDGNQYAAVIDLTFRADPTMHLRGIARRLLEVFSGENELPGGVSKADAMARVDQIADEVAGANLSSSARRQLVRTVCAYLLGIEGITVSGETEY